MPHGRLCLPDPTPEQVEQGELSPAEQFLHDLEYVEYDWSEDLVLYVDDEPGVDYRSLRDFVG